MGEVLGYNGTSTKRLKQWKTMLNLRGCIEYSKNTKSLSLDKEISVYKDFLSEYKAAA